MELSRIVLVFLSDDCETFVMLSSNYMWIIIWCSWHFCFDLVDAYTFQNMPNVSRNLRYVNCLILCELRGLWLVVVRLVVLHMIWRRIGYENPTQTTLFKWTYLVIYVSDNVHFLVWFSTRIVERFSGSTK